MKDSPKFGALYIMAHEVGHYLGRSGHSTHDDYLMADGRTSTGDCTIGREDWRKMNN